MRIINSFLLAILFIFIAGCSTQTVVKYQCQNGQIAYSIGLCEEQKCEVCPTLKCVNISQPYTEKESYQYTFKYGMVDDSTEGIFLEGDDLNWGTKQTTKIKNFEDKEGLFKVEHHYRTLDSSDIKTSVEYIKANATKEFITFFDTALGEDVEVKTEINAPTETRYKEEIKYKTVQICNCS